MVIEISDKAFAVCKVNAIVAATNYGEFYSITKTDNEISVVCEEKYIPKNVLSAECGWRAFRIAGQLDFALIGIIAEISRILADIEISLFVISTYDTDYVLIKSNVFDKAVNELRLHGFDIKYCLTNNSAAESARA